MDGMIGVGLSVLGVCGTITAAIIKFVPRRRENGSRYVTVREFDDLKNVLRIQHSEINASIGSLERLIKSRM